jgi:tRNA-5-methyluridine54 2-sulfurtransferase
MACVRCGRASVTKLRQGDLCRDCFLKYFKKKVTGTVRKHMLLGKNDVLCFAMSGGKDSMAVASVLGPLAKQRRQRVFAIGVDEGVSGYRDRQLSDMKEFCRSLGIEYHIFTFRDEYGKTNEELYRLAVKNDVQISQCTLCGILRRRIMNREARRLGATKMVVGHNLDDEAQTALMNLTKGSVELMARLGPSSGPSTHGGFIQRIKPLYFCTNEETALYTKLMGIKVLYAACPHRKASFRQYAEDVIEGMEKDYPGTKTALVQNMLRLIPILRKEFAGGTVIECAECGEPSKNRVCKACMTLRALGLKGKGAQAHKQQDSKGAQKLQKPHVAKAAKPEKKRNA